MMIDVVQMCDINFVLIQQLREVFICFKRIQYPSGNPDLTGDVVTSVEINIGDKIFSCLTRYCLRVGHRKKKTIMSVALQYFCRLKIDSLRPASPVVKIVDVKNIHKVNIIPIIIYPVAD